jgi:hypothetical protein
MNRRRGGQDFALREAEGVNFLLLAVGLDSLTFKLVCIIERAHNR